MEAVLRTEQLLDLRHLVDLRLRHLSETERWRVVLVVDELVSNAIEHATRCTGLRILQARPGTLVVEVDDLGDTPVSKPTSEGAVHGLAVVSGIASGWGVRQRAGRTLLGDDQDDSVGKTVWCEVPMDDP